MKEIKYPQGTRIKYFINDLKGIGTIVGKSIVDLPIIGGTYIIEPDECIKSEIYPYTHFVANETQFEVIK